MHASSAVPYTLWFFACGVRSPPSLWITFKIHGLGRHVEDRGLIHVVPEPAHTGADQVFHLIAPPAPATLRGEIRERAPARPHVTIEYTAVGIRQEMLPCESRSGTPRSVESALMPGSRITATWKPSAARSRTSCFGFGEILRAPGEDAVSIHVVDVQIDHIAGDRT